MKQFESLLDLKTVIKYKGKTGMIVARMYSTNKLRNEYDLMLVDRKGKREIVKYVSDKEFKVVPMQKPAPVTVAVVVDPMAIAAE